MRWGYHRIVTAAVTYAITGTVLSTAVATAGSIIPDRVEFGAIPHRTITHWPYLYVAGAGVAYYFLYSGPGFFSYFSFYLCVGALLHVLEDMLSKGGVPVGRNPFRGRRKGFGFYKIYELSEMATALLLVVAALGIAAFRGFLTGDYLIQEAGNALHLLKVFGVGLMRL